MLATALFNRQKFFASFFQKRSLSRPAPHAATQLATMLGLLAASPALAAPATLPGTDYAHPQRLVAIDGARRLNLFCMGQGAPVVMLDSGAGDSTSAWRAVQPAVSQFTQVCAYDRAGHGWSDPASRTADLANTVDDLHRLLRAAGLTTPVIYVGHSIAGLYGVYLQAKYPADVQAEVLVDPSFAHQQAHMMAALAPAARATFTALNVKSARDQKNCLKLAQAGALTAPKTAAAKACVDIAGYPGTLDAALKAEILRQAASPSINEASLSEYSNFVSADGGGDADDEELDSVKPDFGGKLLIVLSHGIGFGAIGGLTAAQLAPIETAWQAGHDRLAKLSTRGSNTILPGTHHYIQLDRPDAVIDAVHRAVLDSRAH